MPMSRNSSLSVFDAIGPIMVGPSSSHTAGAVRLGKIARKILGAPPETALIELHGSFADTGRGHGTDKAIVAGLLGLDTDDDQIPESFALAQQQGMTFRIQNIDLGEETHPNTVRLTLTSANQKLEMIGTSTGGGGISVKSLQGYPVKFTGDFNTLLVIAHDQPGSITAITEILANQQINVAFLRVSRQDMGGEAIMVIETDDPIPDNLVRRIMRLGWVYWVTHIDRLED